MAYGRRFRKRRYPTRKRSMRPRYRRRYSKYNARFAGGVPKELKRFDTALNFSFDDTGEVPSTGQLCLIPQGDDATERIGRNVLVKSIHIRGNMELIASSAASRSTSVYLYVVLDTQCNGAAASISDVLTSADMESAMINLDNSNRFKILKKFRFALNPQAGWGTNTNSVQRNIEWYAKCHIPLKFDASAGAITDLTSNNIFLLAGSDGDSNDDTVAFLGTCRLRYYDA